MTEGEGLIRNHSLSLDEPNRQCGRPDKRKVLTAHENFILTKLIERMEWKRDGRQQRINLRAPIYDNAEKP